MQAGNLKKTSYQNQIKKKIKILCFDPLYLENDKKRHTEYVGILQYIKRVL